MGENRALGRGGSRQLGFVLRLNWQKQHRFGARGALLDGQAINWAHLAQFRPQGQKKKKAKLAPRGPLGGGGGARGGGGGGKPKFILSGRARPRGTFTPTSKNNAVSSGRDFLAGGGGLLRAEGGKGFTRTCNPPPRTGGLKKRIFILVHGEGVVLGFFFLGGLGAGGVGCNKHGGEIWIVQPRENIEKHSGGEPPKRNGPPICHQGGGKALEAQS